MRLKSLSSLVLAGTMLFSSFGGSAYASGKPDNPGKGKPETNEYIITFEPHEKDSPAKIHNDHIKGYIKAFNGQVVQEGQELHYAVVNLPNEKVAKALSNKKEIRTISPNTPEEFVPDVLPSGWSATNPNTPQGTGWGYDEVIGEMNSKGIRATGKGVKVLVMDVGATDEHPDTKFEHYNLSGHSTNESTFEDPALGNHAMGVGGVIGAKDNGIGTKGVAPDSRMFYYQVGHLSRDKVLIFPGTTISGLEYAMANGMDIVNMSYGSRAYNPSVDDITKEAQRKGLIMVASAGNESRYNDPTDNHTTNPEGHYPSDYPAVLSISALLSSHKLASYSNWGDVDFTAPTNNPSARNHKAQPGIYYTSSFGGTSSASPFAAGILALYKELYPHYKSHQIMEMAKSDAKDVGLTYDQQGSGRISGPTVDSGIREDQLTHGHALYTASSSTSIRVGESIKVHARLMDEPETVPYKPGQYVRGQDKPFEGATIRHEVKNSAGTTTYTSAITTGTDGRYDITLPTSAFPTAGTYTVFTRYSYTDPVTGQYIYSFKSFNVTVR